LAEGGNECVIRSVTLVSQESELNDDPWGFNQHMGPSVDLVERPIAFRRTEQSESDAVHFSSHHRFEPA
jgi:hypothetical protein